MQLRTTTLLLAVLATSAHALNCKIQVRNSVSSVVGETCVAAGASGSVTSSQTGNVIQFKTSDSCGVGATSPLTNDESLSQGGPC